jgi:glycosyltransferase involved in cell wall biosynthesis
VQSSFSVRRNRKRILLYNHTGQVSGGERMLLLLLRNLQRSCFDPIVACPVAGPLAKASQEMGVEVHGIRTVDARFTLRPDRVAGYAASIVRASADLRSLVHHLHPDLIHANSVRAGLVANLATFGVDVPIIWHVHDILPPHPFSAAIRFLATRSKRTRMIACSAAAARSISRTDQVRMIRNGIELSKFQFQPGMDRGTREELGIGDEFVIGSVGQVAERKGQAGLLESFALTQRSIPNALLLIVGTPLFDHEREYASRLKSRVRELGLEGKVRFLGQRRDIPALMRAFDVFVLNSENEPLGLVLAEAMASGTPVIATRGGGVPEIVIDGRTGRLVEYGDREGLAQAMVELGTNQHLHSLLIGNGRRFVERHLSSTRYVHEVESFYRELLPGLGREEPAEQSYAEVI